MRVTLPTLQRCCSKIFLSALLLVAISFSNILVAQTDGDANPETVILIQTLLSMLPPAEESAQLTRNGEPLKIEISGIDDFFQRTRAEDKITEGLLKRDAQLLVEVFSDYALVPDFDSSSNTTLVFQHQINDSPEKRLLAAVRSQSIENTLQILENESPDVNLSLEETNGWGFYFTPLIVAVSNGQREMVELLLENGALAHTEDENISMPAVGYSIMNGDVELTKLLLDAGTTVDFRAGLLDKEPLATWPVRQGNFEFLKMLVEYGADPAATGIHAWTPLAEAIRLGEIAMAEYLIPIADPRIKIWAEQRVKSDKFPDYRWFPESNALFLAWHFGGDASERLSEKILDRAEALDGVEGRWLIELQAWSSASRLAYAEGDTLGAIEHVERGLKTIDIIQLEATASGDLIKTAMGMLADLHELKLIAGYEFEYSHRAQVAHITAMGGYFQKWHDMLDAIELAKSADPAKVLESWHAAHGVPSRKGWNFTMLNDWVETQSDEVQRDRLFDTLDFFELN